MREGRPEAAPARRGERPEHVSTTTVRETPTMASARWWIDWIDSGHTHWWERERRWREQGHIS